MQLLIFIKFISLCIKQISLKFWFVYDNNKHILCNTNLKKGFIIFLYFYYLQVYSNYKNIVSLYKSNCFNFK